MKTLPPDVRVRRGRDGSIRYRAVIQVAGERIFPGTFDTPEEAHEAAVRAKAEAATTRLTLAEGCDLVRARTKKRRKRDGTVDCYECRFRALKLHLGAERRPKMVDRYYHHGAELRDALSKAFGPVPSDDRDESGDSAQAI